MKHSKTSSVGRDRRARRCASSVRTAPRSIATLLFCILCSTALAAELTTHTINSGGARVSSGSYVLDASIGGIGGIASAGSQVTRHGYAGQLTDVVSLTVTGMPASVNEGDDSQLTGTATLDDDTFTALTGSDIAWSAPVSPIVSITAGGLATTEIVYEDTPADFDGSYLGVNGAGQLLVLDSEPDNFGSYAGDGLPDSWQVAYFGFDNPDADPDADVTGTGQNNLFKYVAGLDPTNAASVFLLRIENVAGQPVQKKLVFSPRFTDRTYTPQYRTNLAGGSYSALTGTTTSDDGLERTVTDLDAAEAQKFYRIQIELPD